MRTNLDTLHTIVGQFHRRRLLRAVNNNNTHNSKISKNYLCVGRLSSRSNHSVVGMPLAASISPKQARNCCVTCALFVFSLSPIQVLLLLCVVHMRTKPHVDVDSITKQATRRQFVRTRFVDQRIDMCRPTPRSHDHEPLAARPFRRALGQSHCNNSFITQSKNLVTFHSVVE